MFALRQNDEKEENSQRLLKAMDTASKANLTLGRLGEKQKLLMIDKTVKLTAERSYMVSSVAVEDLIITVL